MAQAEVEANRVRTLRIVFQGELKDKTRRDKFYHDTKAQLDRLENLIKHYDLELPVDSKQASRTPTAKELRKIVMKCIQNSDNDYSGSQAFQLDPAVSLGKAQREKYLQPLDFETPHELPSKPAQALVAPEQDPPPSPGAGTVSESSYSTAQQSQSRVNFETVSSNHSHHEEIPQQQQPSVSVRGWLKTAGVTETPESERPTPSPLTNVDLESRSLEQDFNEDTPKRKAATAFDEDVCEGEGSKRQKVGSLVLKLGTRNQRSRTMSPTKEAGGLAARDLNDYEQVQALKESELQNPPVADDADTGAVQQSGIAQPADGDFADQQFSYPYGLRGVEDAESRVHGLVQLMTIASHEVIEDLGLEGIQAQFVQDPKPDLQALYKRMMCEDGESWKKKASQLGLHGLKMQHLLTMCIGAAVYEEVFGRKLPWKTSRDVMAQPEISGRLESLAELICGLDARGPYANAAYLIYQSGADMLREGSDFDQGTIVPEAQSLAETFLLTIQAQLKCCKSKLNVPDEFSEKTTDALAKIFRKALLLRGSLEEAPHDFEYTWKPSMSPFVEKDMAEVRSLEEVESVVGAIFPGIWRRDEQGELHLVSRLQVYGRAASKKQRASKA